MDFELRSALDYLLPPAESFWRWGDGEALEWRHRKTIAFRYELRTILQRFTDTGAPSLGALLLLLAAARDSWREEEETRALTCRLDGLPDADHARQVLDRVLEKLDRVHALPADCRQPLEAKTVLAEMVFEAAGNILTTPDVARAVVRALDDRVYQDADPRAWGFSNAMLLRDLMCLSRSLDRLQPEAIRNRLRTGLETLPQAAEPLDIGSQVRSLLAELRDEPQWSGLSGLARQLMAAVTLPRRISESDALPAGGVSDISNRGELHQLLVSELANDDLTLAVRVAMNEALYLRREAPRNMQPSRRLVLLDSGIASWGLPRLYATAVALATAAVTAPGDEPVFLRARQAALDEVDLTTREGLTSHLATLDLACSPAAAWPGFCQRCESGEALLITTTDAWEDGDMRQAVEAGGLQEFLLIELDRDGGFHLRQATRGSVKTIRSAQLDLSDLLESPQEAAALRDDYWLDDLPEAFRHRVFPLRLPLPPVGEDRWIVAERGTLALTRDRRVMYWPGFFGRSQTPPGGSAAGAMQIFGALPGGPRLIWASHRVDQQQRALAILGDPPQLLAVDLRATPRCALHKLPQPAGKVRTAVLHNGALMLIHTAGVDTFDLETLTRLQQLSVKNGPFWVRDRFFYHQRWLSLVFDGQAARFVPVEAERINGAAHGSVIELFDRDGVEGPVAVTNRGVVYEGAFGEAPLVPDSQRSAREREASAVKVSDFSVPLAKPLRVSGISRDGHRLVLASADQPRGANVELDLRTESVRTVNSPPSTTLPPAGLPPTRSVRSKFTHAGYSLAGQLLLVTRRGRVMAVRMRAGCMVLASTGPIPFEGTELAQDAMTPKLQRVLLPLRPCPVRGPESLRLQWVKFPSGAELMMDKRGLLHCRNTNSPLPELCIALHTQQLAGWASNGQFWGDPFFTAQHPVLSDQQAFQTLVQPFVDEMR